MGLKESQIVAIAAATAAATITMTGIGVGLGIHYGTPNVPYAMYVKNKYTNYKNTELKTTDHRLTTWITTADKFIKDPGDKLVLTFEGGSDHLNISINYIPRTNWEKCKKDDWRYKPSYKEWETNKVHPPLYDWEAVNYLVELCKTHSQPAISPIKTSEQTGPAKSDEDTTPIETPEQTKAAQSANLARSITISQSVFYDPLNQEEQEDNECEVEFVEV